jgi:hypothetical protein
MRATGTAKRVLAGGKNVSRYPGAARCAVPRALMPSLRGPISRSGPVSAFQWLVDTMGQVMS